MVGKGKEGGKGQLLLPYPQVLLETELCLVELYLFDRNLLNHVSVKSCWEERSVSQFIRFSPTRGAP